MQSAKQQPRMLLQKFSDLLHIFITTQPTDKMVRWLFTKNEVKSTL